MCHSPKDQSHSDTPLHPPLVGDDPEDPDPTQDSHLFPATPYPEADIGQVEGPNTFTTTIELVSSTESRVAPAQRCTLARQVGHWNIA